MIGAGGGPVWLQATTAGEEAGAQDDDSDGEGGDGGKNDAAVEEHEEHHVHHRQTHVHLESCREHADLLRQRQHAAALVQGGGAHRHGLQPQHRELCHRVEAGALREGEGVEEATRVAEGVE
eukprot:CAMPEP_0196730870 /NCGR_PEP_ID=MMETSP1091-20130531/10803_1 /TAXON_ID=302021 /ORGANISM="Rhodomonas sp., Strain CCMP768" /LENGTH=121 /DNA_ID=CAMNT_0042073951 /DNA_START=12 /DNA_END=375 /DNA_ORIENTATION=+